MANECKDCGMEFETSGQLDNHQKKFCLGANGNEEAIEKRLEELKRMEHDLDYTWDAQKANKAAAPKSSPLNVNVAAAAQAQERGPVSPAAGQGQQAAYMQQPHQYQQQPQQQAPPQQTFMQQPQPQQYNSITPQAPSGMGVGYEFYMADQLRRLEDTVRRQEDRIKLDRDQNDVLRAQLNSEMEKLKTGAPAPLLNQTAKNVGLEAYPSQLNNGSGQEAGGEATDEILLNKLHELENYLQNNPNRYQQINNPQQPVNPFSNRQSLPQNTQALNNLGQTVKLPTMVPAPIADPSYYNILANPSGNRMLDDLERAYKLRQDLDRCDDLESEEKAMVNLTAQEYDGLKMLSSIPEHSDLYKFKMEQYRQISNARVKAEIYLQEQRLKRLTKNFDMQSKEVERRYQHEQWMDQQKRRLFLQKLENLNQEANADLVNGGMTLEPGAGLLSGDLNNIQTGLLNKGTDLLNSVVLDSERREAEQIKSGSTQNNSLSRVKEESSVGQQPLLVIAFDQIFNADIDIQDCELCFCMQRMGSVLADPQPSLVKMSQRGPDLDQSDVQRLFFNHLEEFPQLEAPLTLIVEVRKFDPEVPNSLKSVAWTMIPLYTKHGTLNVGKWRAPMYRCPTKLALDILLIDNEPRYDDFQLCVRIGNAQEASFRSFVPAAAKLLDYIPVDYYTPLNKQNSHFIKEEINRQRTGASSPRQVAMVPQQEDFISENLSNMSETNVNQLQSNSQRQEMASVSAAQKQESIHHKKENSFVSNASQSQKQQLSSNRRETNSVKKASTKVSENQFGSAVAEKDQFYVCKGLQLDVNYLRMPETYENLYVQATLYLGKEMVMIEADKEKGSEAANWITKEIAAEDAKEVPASAQVDISKEGLTVLTEEEGAPNGKNKGGPHQFLYPVNEKTVWLRDFYDMQWQNNLKYRFVLLVQVLVRDKKTSKMTSIGYTVQELSQSEGRLKFGTFTSPLLIPPISFKDINENPSPLLENAQISFSLSQPDSDRINTAQFIVHQERQYTLTEFWKDDDEDGIDIYIDMIRHFPENVTIVKIIAKVISADKEDLLKPKAIFPKLKESTFQSQTYNVKLECRGIDMPPTSLLHISFITIDATSLKEKLVGFSFFPLYVNTKTRAPVLPQDNLTVEGENRTLHKGCYQMPIYCQYPPVSDQITYKDFVFLERIPNSSVLIRVDYASIDNDGNFISVNDPDPAIRELAFESPPAYTDQVYSTTYFLSSDIERELFMIRHQRQTDAPLKEVLEAIIEVWESQEEQAFDINNDRQLMEVFQKRMEDVQELPLLELMYFSSYEPKIGFRYNLETLNNLPEQPQRLYQVLTSICPPGSPYLSENKNTFASFPFSFLDWESTTRQIEFLEDDIVMNNIALFRSSVIIVDVVAFDTKSRQFEPFGFAVLPLIKVFQGRNYLSSGIHILPLYAGEVPADFCEKLVEQPNLDPDAVLQIMKEEGEINYAANDAFCVLKAVDSQRHAHYLKPLDQQRPSQSFLNPDETQIYNFDPTLPPQGRLLADLVGKGPAQREIQQELTEKFAKHIRGV